MAGVEPYGASHILRTPNHLKENDSLSGDRRLARRGAGEVRSRPPATQRQRSVQGKNTSATRKSSKRCSVGSSPRYKIVKRRKLEDNPKRVRGRHKVTCEACSAYGTLIECDTCTSSWHSQCVRVGLVPDPASPPAYWSCPKCVDQRSQGVKRSLKGLVPPSQEGSKVNFGRVPGVSDVRSRGTVSRFQEVQQCCLKLPGAIQPGAEKSQPTIQVLQEALSANVSQLEALKLEANRRSIELEEVKQERERVAAALLEATAELNHIKAENTESTSRMDGIMKIVEGFFVHRRNV